MLESEGHWYALYTASRAEKKVKERFEEDNIHHYLPLKTVTRIWSDRKKEVIEPVIRGYIFVKVKKKDFRKLLSTQGVVNFIREKGIPVPIPENQIENMRYMIERAQEEVEFTMEEIQPGASIRIVKGELEGLVGELVRIKGKYKVVVRLEKFGCALTTIALSSVEKLS